MECEKAAFEHTLTFVTMYDQTGYDWCRQLLECIWRYTGRRVLRRVAEAWAADPMFTPEKEYEGPSSVPRELMFPLDVLDESDCRAFLALVDISVSVEAATGAMLLSPTHSEYSDLDLSTTLSLDDFTPHEYTLPPLEVSDQTDRRAHTTQTVASRMPTTDASPSTVVAVFASPSTSPTATSSTASRKGKEVASSASSMRRSEKNASLVARSTRSSSRVANVALSSGTTRRLRSSVAKDELTDASGAV